MLTILHLVLLVASIFGGFQQTAAQSCKNPRVRKEWRDLSSGEKRSYLDAVQCLRTKPSITSTRLNNTRSPSRYEDFTLLHIVKTKENALHNVAQFTGWHRYYLWAFESALIKECGYQGAQPYWNETKDAGRYSSSPLLDGSDLSFGSAIGKGPGNCVNDGYFKDAVNSLGPGTGAVKHCIRRRAIDSWTDGSFSARMDLRQPVFDNCYNQNKFSTFRTCLEGGPHAQGHNVMGGEMTNVYSSPGDPLFWMHHGMIDYVWAEWQSKDRNRIFDLSGPTRADGSRPITLTYTLDMKGLFPNVPIRDVMDTTSGALCYTYQDSS